MSASLPSTEGGWTGGCFCCRRQSWVARWELHGGHELLKQIGMVSSTFWYNDVDEDGDDEDPIDIIGDPYRKID